MFRYTHQVHIARSRFPVKRSWWSRDRTSWCWVLNWTVNSWVPSMTGLRRRTGHVVTWPAAVAGCRHVWARPGCRQLSISIGQILHPWGEIETNLFCSYFNLNSVHSNKVDRIDRLEWREKLFKYSNTNISRYKWIDIFIFSPLRQVNVGIFIIRQKLKIFLQYDQIIPQKYFVFVVPLCADCMCMM